MSEDPLRKSVPRKDVDERLKSNCTKASGDAIPEKKASRSKSKCRIPKNLRYDLENALVGLCDVWFEEIKPYLVKNNIKIHLHNDTGDGSGDRGLVTSNCSHLDPGRSDVRASRRHRTNASYADYCSTRQTVLKAQHHKQQQPPVAAATTQTPSKWKKEKTRKRRKCRETEPRQPIPRLCHSYNVPLSFTKERNTNLTQTHYFLYNKDLTSRKPKLKHANTQTDTVYPNKDVTPKKIFKSKCPTTSVSPRPATTSYKKQHDDDYPLFPDDLIDLIAKKHDKKLQVLFVSPRKDYSTSVMNLNVPSNSKRGCTGFCKTPPWR